MSEKVIAVKNFTRNIDYHGSRAILMAQALIRNLSNQTPYFSLTGEIKISGRRDSETCGMIHDEIEKYIPELKKYFKWHLTSLESPMHYVANAMYFASDRDCWGKRKGEEKSFETWIYFDDVPIGHKLPNKFVEWLGTHSSGY